MSSSKTDTPSFLRRFAPILAAILAVGLLGGWVYWSKQRLPGEKVWQLGSFTPPRPCHRLPRFLEKLHAPKPVMIDLSQIPYRGVAFRAGPGLKKILHPKAWERFGPFGTYALDREGNLYLAPMPFISIEPTTFTLQKKLFRLDSQTGKLKIWMEFDDVHPSPQNPYGVVSVAYDCEDGSLWVSAIDESDYRTQRGVLYHVDPRNKKVLTKREGVDLLTIRVLRTKKGKVLLGGSARNPVLLAFELTKEGEIGAPHEILQLPDPSLRIRKIKVTGPNRLLLETIPFSYTLIAQTDGGGTFRRVFEAEYDTERRIWHLKEKRH